MDIFHFSLLTCFCHWLRMTTSNKRIWWWWWLSALEALHNALHKFKTYLLTYLFAVNSVRSDAKTFNDSRCSRGMLFLCLSTQTNLQHVFKMSVFACCCCCCCNSSFISRLHHSCVSQAEIPSQISDKRNADSATNVSSGSVATYLRWGEKLRMRFRRRRSLFMQQQLKCTQMTAADKLNE